MIQPIEKFKYKIYLDYLVNGEEKMGKIIEMGTISSRGQIAIPAGVRRALELNEGERVIFVVEKDTLIIKKVDAEKTWEEITRPLREAMAKTNLKESDAVDIVHRFRKAKKLKNNENNH